MVGLIRLDGHMSTEDEHLLLKAQWAADCLLRSTSRSAMNRTEATNWILQDPTHVRELLLAAALDLALRMSAKPPGDFSS